MGNAPNRLAELADRLDIGAVLARYCRGIDRCDAEELRRVFIPDARIDYGSGPQARDGAIDQLLAGLRAMQLTQHSISNALIDLAGDTARAETYCTALHIIGMPGQRIEMVVGGRYLDTLVRTDEGWQISERLYVMDWNRQGPSTMQDSGGLYDTLARRGARWPDDPSYAWRGKEGGA
jgi:hypothetical protein